MKKTWIKIKRGFLDPEHRTAMGIRVWLYLYMIDCADWETGTIREWKDKQAADDLQMPLGTLRDQRQELENLRYIDCRQNGYSQIITIKKWVDPRSYSGEVLNDDEGTGKGEGEGKGEGMESSAPLHNNHISHVTVHKNQSENKNQFSDDDITEQLDTTINPLNREESKDLPSSNDSKALNLNTKLNVPRPEPTREPCDMDGITESMGLGYGGVKKRKSWITPEMQTLANKFCELSGVKFPLIKDKKDYGANAISWWKPLERMLYEVDYNVDRACELMEQGVDYMRSINYVVIAPQSVEKAFVGAKVGGKKKTIRAKDAYDNWVEVEV